MTSKKTSHNDRIQSRILEHLQTLRIPLSEERLDQLLAEGQRTKLSGLEILERVLAEPASSRLERAVARRIREAKFRSSATLESFDWTFNAKTISREPFEELATGDFVRRKHPSTHLHGRRARSLELSAAPHSSDQVPRPLPESFRSGNKIRVLRKKSLT